MILEVGCSSGFMLRLIRERFPRALTIGADYVPGPLLNLAQEIPDIPLLQFDLTTCPLPDQSIDAIVLLNVLEHIQDDAAAMNQVSRILKPGGIVVIEAPAGPHLYDVYDQLLMHYRRYSMAALRTLARGANLRILHQSHLGCLVYPGFWWVKRRNRRFLGQEEFVQKGIVAKSIAETKKNRLLNMILQIEGNLGKWIPYPIGIRCLMTCQKVSQRDVACIAGPLGN